MPQQVQHRLQSRLGGTLRPLGPPRATRRHHLLPVEITEAK
jgi:hypothetical protein